MKLGFKIVFFTFLVLFGIDVISASTGICCYDGGSSNTIRWSFADSCYEGEVEVGDFNERPDCKYDYLKMGCMVGNICYERVFGNYIYNFPEVYSYFEEKYGINLNSDNKVCDSLVKFADYDCSGNYYNSNLINTSNQNNNNNYNNGSNLNPDDYNSENNSIQETQDMLFCSSVGEPFGFFATPNECNELTNDNETYPCIYNPYLSGFLKVSSEEDTSLGIGILEEGCMAKSQIKSCADYKTKNNCEANPVWNDPDYSNSNLQSCRWVPVNSYFYDFDVDAGICISNAVTDSKNYNFGYYSNRLNLLSNPSFEDGLNGWDSTVTLNQNQIDAYDGLSTVTLDVGQYLKQNIYYLDSDVGYRSMIHIKSSENYISNDRITLTITEFNKDGSSDESSYFVDLASLSDLNGIYTGEFFSEHIISDGTEHIEYKLSSNKKVEIDALTFEIYDTDNLIVDNGVFKPIEIVDSKASNCGLCFDKNQLNFCTQDKSNLMGDCSYMVDDLSDSYSAKVSGDKYLGKDDNNYINNWSSQSIVNAKLFCEMYVNNDYNEEGYLQGACENPNNYVNSKFGNLHPLIDGTLCKWNSIYGCYKDSDGEKGPDTVNNGGVYLHYLVADDLDKEGHSSAWFSNYSYSNNGEYVSDFAYACDMVPPQSYVYFTAKDVNGTEILITDDFPDKVLGDIQVHLEVNDFATEACDNYNIPRNLFIDYIVNDKTYFTFIPNSFVTQDMSIKDLVIGRNGNSLLEDGYNNIKLEIKDQSGNIGKIRTFTVNGDFAGPNITPLSDLGVVIGPNSTLNFSIKDKTEITSCNFALNPLPQVVYNNGIKDDYYEPSGDFFNFSKKYGNDIYGFELPIYDTTENLNVYELSITCTDLFGQVSNETYQLFTDYDTSFVMQNPLTFLSYNSDTGFMNSEKQVWATSVEQNLQSCEFDFKNTDGSGSLTVDEVGEGFTVDSYSSDIIFYSNITGNLDFETTGIKNISIICKDNAQNEISKDFIYYYDTVLPTLEKISLSSNSVQTKTVLEVNGSYYVRRINRQSTALDTILNVTIDGTQSWPSDNNISLKYYKNGSYDGDMPDLTVGDLVLNESTYSGTISLTNFDNIRVYAGEKINDFQEFFVQKYMLTFSDKAGNINSEPFEFYFDDTVPILTFKDNVLSYGNDLFTKEADPLFGITFNTPEYREFSCSLNIPHKSGEYNKVFGFTNYLRFRLSEIIPDFTISSNEEVKLNFDCVDKYDYHITGSYKLNYDNTPPVLDDVYFNNGNKVYLPNSGDNYVYSNVEDSLVFKFEDTNEKAYECSYSFSSDDYDCKNTVFNETFEANENLKFLTGNINVLSESYNDSVCYRNRNVFNQKLTAAREDGSRLETLIHVTAQCHDKVNYNTQKKVFDYQVNYVTGSKFVDFDVNYDVDTVTFEITSLDEFDSVVVSFDADGQEEIMKLTPQGETSSGVYVYKGTKSLSALGYPEEDILIWGIGYWATGEVADRITTQIVIDNQIPNGILRFPDADENNSIFANEFEIKIKAEDFGGSKLNRVDLYLENNKIFSTQNQSQYMNGSLIILDGKNYFSWNNDEYYGDLIFINGQIGGTYKFTLKVYDGFGNMNETSQIIYVKDGISIRLQDSDNAVVDYGGFNWITKSSAPKVSFTTSRYVDKCTIYPFEDEKWTDVLTDNNLDQITKSKFGGRGDAEMNFSFDLSEFENFNLDLIDDKSVEVGIRCVGLDDGKTYSFKRTLDYIDTLPDYVLTSSEGFTLNGGDYKTIVNVKSVGANKYINCEYSIDGATPVKFSDSYNTKFSEEISFNSKATGIHDLTLACSDKLGTRGPTKTYQFVINKNTQIEISDLKLTFGSNKEYESSSDDKIFIGEFRNLGLEFKTNRKDISCSVEIEKSSGSFFRNIFYFVENLFTGQRDVPITDETNYVYNIDDGLEFSSTGENILRIVCTGGNTFEKEYTVNYIEEASLDFNLVRVE